MKHFFLIKHPDKVEFFHLFLSRAPNIELNIFFFGVSANTFCSYKTQKEELKRLFVLQYSKIKTRRGRGSVIQVQNMFKLLFKFWEILGTTQRKKDVLVLCLHCTW